MTSEPAPREPSLNTPLVHWEIPAPSTARLPVGAAVGKTLEVYGSQLSLFLAVALPVALASATVTVAPLSLGPIGLAATAIVLGIVAFVASTVMIVASHEAFAGREGSIGGVLRPAIRRTPALFGIYLLALPVIALGALVVAAGLVLAPAFGAILAVVLVVAFLQVALRLAPIGQVVVLEGLGGMGALRRAWELTKGSSWRLIGLFLVLGLITLPASIGLQLIIAVSTEPVITGTTMLLSTLVTTPVLAIGSTVAWAALAERADAGQIRNPGRARAIALVLVLGFGTLLAGVGFSQGAATSFAGLIPQPGVIVAGTSQNVFDPCSPNEPKERFAAGEEIWIGGYFTEPIPDGRQAELEIYLDGVLSGSVPLVAEGQSVACYYEESSLTDAPAASYRILIRYSGRPIAEGAFVVEP